MTIAIQGIGVVGGFGCGTADLARAMALGAAPAAALRADPGPLERFVPRRSLRRLDRFARMAALAAHLALEDAGALGDDHDRLGLVVASGWGATGTTLDLVDSIIEGGDVCTSPSHFAGSLHNAPASHLAILLGARGPSLSISQFGLSAPSALMAARLWLERGRAQRVLVGAVDELSGLTGHLWDRQGELERPWGPGPRGEGGAFFLLSSRAEAREPYCLLEQAITGRGPGPEGLAPAGTSPLYGAMPAAPAFDLAAAAIRLRQGQGPERVSCLTRDQDQFGLVQIRSFRR